jgi:hypothetical protein
MDTGSGRRAPSNVQYNAAAFFDRVRAVIGTRLAESRFDEDGGVRVTVIDLADDDRLSIIQIARGLGILEWARASGPNRLTSRGGMSCVVT